MKECDTCSDFIAESCFALANNNLSETGVCICDLSENFKKEMNRNDSCQSWTPYILFADIVDLI